MSQSLPFSRPFAVSSLRDSASQILVIANATERAALAADFGLVAIAKLEAEFRARRDGRTGIRFSGTINAEITQNCVLTLEPFDSNVSAPIEAHFDSGIRAEENAFGLEDMDPPDLIIDGKIDLGALAAEFLALSLDPYPRKPDAIFAAEELGVVPEKITPFADLQARIAASKPKK